MGAALGYNDTLDEMSATRTRVAVLLVDRNMVIIVARLAPEIAIIVE